MVYGAAMALMPEKPEAAEGVSVAVFESFACRWRSLSRKTFVAAWLLRTVRFTAARERRNLGLKAKAATTNGVLAQRLFKEVNRLKERPRTAVVLRCLLQAPVESVAVEMHRRPARVEKWVARALAKITKPLEKVAKKLGVESPGDVGEMLMGIPVTVPPEVEHCIMQRIAQWSPVAKRSEMVTATLRAWRWWHIRRAIKGAAISVAATVCVLASLGGTLAYLAQNGYLTLWFITNSQRGLAKEFPGMLQRARPWPVNESERAMASSKIPETSAELYGLTNIWPAKLSLTPAQWREVQPKRVPLVNNMNRGGKMALRNPKASRSGLAGVLGIDFHWTEAKFDIAGKKFERIGVRHRGNGTYLSSLHGIKQSYKADLNRLVKGQDFAGLNTLNFINSIPDFSYLKDALAEKLFRELGAVAPRTAYAYLSIDVPGRFTNQALGLYVMIEDIDGNFGKDRFGTKAAPIFKPVTYDLFGDWGDDWKAYADIYDLKTKATPEQLARVVEFAKLVAHADDAEFARRLPAFLDVEEYAAFVAGHVLLSSYDGYLSNGQNFYIYLDPRSNRIGFIPWDQDHAWGEFGYVSTAEKRETASIWKPSTYDNKFLHRVMKVEAFRDAYRHKLEEALAGPFTVERLNREIDALAAVVQPAVAAESDFRLDRFKLAISADWVKGRRDGSMNDNSAEGPKAPIHQLKRFIQARTQSVRDQLIGKSEGAKISGFNP